MAQQNKNGNPLDRGPLSCDKQSTNETQEASHPPTQVKPQPHLLITGKKL